MAQTVARLVQVGIPVVGHIGLTPQSVHQLGYRQQGKTRRRKRILAEAIALNKLEHLQWYWAYSNAVGVADYAKLAIRRLALVQVHTVMVRY